MLDEPLTPEEFTKEMRILWQNNIAVRELLGCIIRSYFNKGNRAHRIIQTFQESTEG